MTSRLAVRNALPLVYVVLVLAAFFIATIFGFLVLVGGAVGFFMLAAALSEPPEDQVEQQRSYRSWARETARGYRRVTPGRSE